MYILDKKTTREQKLSKTRSFTACVEECFNGFHIIRQLNQCEQKKKKREKKKKKKKISNQLISFINQSQI